MDSENASIEDQEQSEYEKSYSSENRSVGDSTSPGLYRKRELTVEVFVAEIHVQIIR